MATDDITRRAGWWWIDRWRKSTAYTDLTLSEQGAYRNLLDELWLRGGVLPADDRVLAKISGDAVEWPKVRARVLERFYKCPEGYRNQTHDEVSKESKRRADKQKAWRDRQRDGNGAGNAGGNGNDNESRNVTHSPGLGPGKGKGPYKRQQTLPATEAGVELPEKPSKPRPDSWLEPYAKVYRDRFGAESVIPWRKWSGFFAKAEAALKGDRLACVERWGRFCDAATEATFATPAKFGETLGQWGGKSPFVAPGGAQRVTADAERWSEDMRKQAEADKHRREAAAAMAARPA